MIGDDEEGIRLLEGAYALETPDDNLAYYRDFARHYDQSFAATLGYIYPSAIVRCLAGLDLPQGRILDIGCGTGLVAARLKEVRADLVIDGVDISPEMLSVARDKKLYNALYEADLTADLSGLPTDYAAIISAGTFTHGHLGPAPIAGLVGHCCSGAQAVIGVNAQHHAQRGFGAFMDGLVDAGLISPPTYEEVLIYQGADTEHANDKALIMGFTVI
jgi:SAM-dependent methyltransferase